MTAPTKPPYGTAADSASERAPGEPLHAPVIDWFDEHARDLPWRRPEAGAWAVMVSEFMLQQTPVNRVLPVYEQWLARWPRPADLAAEAPGEAVRAWGRLGYPRRALRLHGAAVAIAERHGGDVPREHAAVAGAARHRRVHRRGRGLVRVRAAARRAGHQRAAGLRPGGRPASQYPPNATTAAERQLRPRAAARRTRRRPRAGPRPPWSWARWCARRRNGRAHRCPIAAQCAWRLAGKPAHDGPPRRGQTYAGTDRQVRGRLLAVLREAHRAGAAGRAGPGVARAGAARPRAGRPGRGRPGRTDAGRPVPAAADLTRPARSTLAGLGPAQPGPQPPVHPASPWPAPTIRTRRPPFTCRISRRPLHPVRPLRYTTDGLAVRCRRLLRHSAVTTRSVTSVGARRGTTASAAARLAGGGGRNGERRRFTMAQRRGARVRGVRPHPAGRAAAQCPPSGPRPGRRAGPAADRAGAHVRPLGRHRGQAAGRRLPAPGHDQHPDGVVARPQAGGGAHRAAARSRAWRTAPSSTRTAPC